MKKSILFLISILSFSVFATSSLETGDYGVTLKNRAGETKKCTLSILNNTAENILVLNIADCPPKVIDVVLYPSQDGDFYVSEEIYPDTRREGYKFYEIRELSAKQFEMTSHRVYGDGGIGKPRKIIATKK